MIDGTPATGVPRNQHQQGEEEAPLSPPRRIPQYIMNCDRIRSH